ncbi:hypothetical protein L7F22_018905 [Adiantum nelumboides]|nr:hypothetical protein [Adiantum nelumboides]
MEVDEDRSLSPLSQFSDGGGANGKESPSSGPIRKSDPSGSNRSTAAGSASSSKPSIAAPVKSACTFCRSRKSRCNGKQPCAACINRGRTDDCVYTISRRGGKPKSKSEKLEPLEMHLEKLLGLSELPHLVRIPNAMPQLQTFQQDQGNDFDPYQGIDPTRMLQQQQNNNSAIGAYGTPQYQQSQATIGSPMNLFQSPALSSATPSAKSLVKDYYTHIYRFVPVLPDPKFIDALTNCIQPGSPLLLSLQCVIPILRDQTLLPQQQPFATPEAKKDAIRAEALFYAKQAYDAIDEVLERVEQEQDKEDASILEVIQALCILVIYEYGSGRALKSRLKVDAALTLAMSKGLHRLSSTSSRPINASDQGLNGQHFGVGQHYLTQLPDEEVYEVKKRTWWNLWMLAMWTAYNTGRIPTVRADDSRVTSELPSSPNGNINLWPNVITSLQGLLLVQDRVLSLAHIEHGRLPVNGIQDPSTFGNDGNRQNGSRHPEIPQTFSGQPTLSSKDEILRSMVELDENIQKKMLELEQTTYGIVGPSDGISTHNANEDETQRILKFLWAIQLYTTSLTLHIGQAFHGASLFERKLCFLSSISETASDPAACQVPMPNAFEGDHSSSSNSNINPVTMAPMMDLYARGPFKPRDSLKRCVDASDKLLSISRNLRKSEGHMAYPNPFNACSFVLISFVCLMQALAISTSSMQEEDPMLAASLDRGNEDGTFGQNSTSQGSTSTSTLLRTAQSAAALTPAVGQTGSINGISSPPSLFGSGVGGSSGGDSKIRPPSQQAQLQNIWARVKEARDALQGLSKYWDMVIPMREEVTGCLQASQFLLSQHPNPEQDMPPPSFSI